MTGVYSQVGFITGTVSGSQLTGNWYEAGTPRGTFTLTLATDAFSGSFTTIGQTGTKNWAETRTGTTTPTDQQCWAQTAPAQDVNKHWIKALKTPINDPEDICLSTDKNTCSSSYITTYTSAPTVGVPGYSDGACFEQGSICQGYWYEADNSYGPYLFSATTIAAVPRLYFAWWTGNSIKFSDNTNTDVHGYGKPGLSDGGAPVNCSRSVNFKFPIPGAASSLTLSAALLVLVAFLFY